MRPRPGPQTVEAGALVDLARAIARRDCGEPPASPAQPSHSRDGTSQSDALIVCSSRPPCPAAQGTGITADPSTPSGTIVLPDRKSTRLNSSHANISYAVFCLKTKKNTKSSAVSDAPSWIRTHGPLLNSHG